MKRSAPSGIPEDERRRILERPDGFYFRSEDGRREYGPYPSMVEAVAEMEATDEGGYEPGESLAEAEDEIGISNWIDPDTGEPAEEGIPRTEDH